MSTPSQLYVTYEERKWTEEDKKAFIDGTYHDDPEEKPYLAQLKVGENVVLEVPFFWWERDTIDNQAADEIADVLMTLFDKVKQW